MAKFMFIAGEASGDTLGAELMRALRQELAPEEVFAPEFFGAGGARMRAEGMQIDVDLTQHAVVGLVEVLKNYGKFRAFFHELLDIAFEREPDFIILIDYPGFNLRFARAIRARLRRRNPAFNNWNPRIIYYVSPQIWAWHESRVYQIARDVDLLLSIFPFEKEWYASRVPEFRVEFVGHPLVDRYANYSAPDMAPEEAPLVVLLPGSREREIERHMPVLVEAARIIREQSRARFLIVAASEPVAGMIRRFPIGDLPIQVGGLSDALRKASLAMAASGTVTLECAFFQVPTIVFYRTSWSTYRLGRIFIKVPYIAMPNLLAREEVFPEFIQDAATPEALARSAVDFLNNPSRRSLLRLKLATVMRSLGEPGASRRAARALRAMAESR